MLAHKKSVALVTSSPALGSIIAMLLEQETSLVAQQFAGIESLMAHMRLLSVDLIVADFELETETLPDLVAKLRNTLPQRRYQLIALTSHVSREIKLSCRFAGVDEVIIKPMSPLFLKERMLDRLGIEALDRHRSHGFGVENLAQERGAPVRTKYQSNPGSNVISLFGNRGNGKMDEEIRPA